MKRLRTERNFAISSHFFDEMSSPSKSKISRFRIISGANIAAKFRQASNVVDKLQVAINQTVEDKFIDFQNEQNFNAIESH